MSKVKLLVSIDKDLNDEFRKVLARDYVYQRGLISHAVEEAIKLWIKHRNGKVKVTR